MSSTRPLGLMIAATALFAPLACAQFAPPPLQQSKPLAMPEFKLPALAQGGDGGIKDIADGRNKRKEELAKLRSPAALPELEFESLIAFDDDGRVIRLAGVPEFVALDRHPMIHKRVRPKVERAITDRRHHIERSMLDHLDALEVIETGALDRLSAFDLQSLSSLRLMLQPLVGTETALTEYQRVGAITPVQIRFLREKMVRPYTKALSEDLNSYQQYDAQGNPISLYDAIVRHAMNEQVAEVMGIYHDLLIETSERGPLIAAVLHARIADPDHELAELLGTATANLPSADRDTQLAAMQELMAKLTLDQRRTLLETALDTRR